MPIKSKEFDLLLQSTPETTFNYDFLTALMVNCNLIRNVALVGHLHSGKTTLTDVFVQQTHPLAKINKYTDTRLDE
jgi:U5 small nuclear ribonucleoprotein component